MRCYLPCLPDMYCYVYLTGLVGELVGRWCVANMLTTADHAKRGNPSSSETDSQHEGISLLDIYG